MLREGQSLLLSDTGVICITWVQYSREDSWSPFHICSRARVEQSDILKAAAEVPDLGSPLHGVFISKTALQTSGSFWYAEARFLDGIRGSA
jgi:hypothetical protein